MSMPAYGKGQVKLRAAEKIPEKRWLMVASRPALAEKGIVVDRITVQTGPDGDLTAMVRNEGSREVRIEKGQRLAQGVLLPPCVDPSVAAGRGDGRRARSARVPD